MPATPTSSARRCTAAPPSRSWPPPMAGRPRRGCRRGARQRDQEPLSLPVGLDELRARIDEFVTDACLLTVSADPRAHRVAVRVRWDDDEIVISAGNTSR